MLDHTPMDFREIILIYIVRISYQILDCSKSNFDIFDAPYVS